jgi:hypothetical protein
MPKKNPNKEIEGLLESGNLSPTGRPILWNEDGSYSTISSASRGQNGKEVLYPTVVDGRRLKTDVDPNQDEAWQHYLKIGENFGKFDTYQNADKHAETIHNLGADEVSAYQKRNKVRNGDLINALRKR